MSIMTKVSEWNRSIDLENNIGGRPQFCPIVAIDRRKARVLLLKRFWILIIRWAWTNIVKSTEFCHVLWPHQKYLPHIAKLECYSLQVERFGHSAHGTFRKVVDLQNLFHGYPRSMRRWFWISSIRFPIYPLNNMGTISDRFGTACHL